MSSTSHENKHLKLHRYTCPEQACTTAPQQDRFAMKLWMKTDGTVGRCFEQRSILRATTAATRTTNLADVTKRICCTLTLVRCATSRECCRQWTESERRWQNDNTNDTTFFHETWGELHQEPPSQAANTCCISHYTRCDSLSPVRGTMRFSEL